MYWQRRKNGNVYVFETKGGKVTTLPRSKTRHLDSQPDDVVQRFVESLQPRAPRPRTEEKLTRYIEDYCAFESTRGLSRTTLEMHKHALVSRIVPFFLSQEPPMTDPNAWPFRCAKLFEHLTTSGLSDALLIKCNAALRRFWSWLQDEGLVDASIALRLRRPRMLIKATPLQYALTPEAVLAYARAAEPEMAFLALAGFFFSLRTQETLALLRGDFRAGSGAAELECSRVMVRAGLYNRLAVYVTKQNSKSARDVAAPPKAGSKGWVACFDESAAKLLVPLVKLLAERSVDQSAPLVKFSVDWNLHRWAAGGIPGVTLKDLRRASIYWLGHHTSLGLVPLKNHARHAKVDTTALYLRRPEESVGQLDELDLDA